MSTRGCVAVGTPDKWRGVYNHYDSYPTGLGAELWAKLHEVGIGRLRQTCDEILSFDDWRAYLAGGICEYCGKKTGQPHSINGLIIGGFDQPDPKQVRTKKAFLAWMRLATATCGEAEFKRRAEADWPIFRNRIRTGYPDPEALHHLHNDVSKGVASEHITSTAPDPLFIEWVYVINPDKATLAVLEHRSLGEEKFKALGLQCNRDRQGPKRMRLQIPEDGIDVTIFNYGRYAYWHKLVTEVPLAGTEPNWEQIGSTEEE